MGKLPFQVERNFQRGKPVARQAVERGYASQPSPAGKVRRLDLVLLAMMVITTSLTVWTKPHHPRTPLHSPAEFFQTFVEGHQSPLK
ncbi:hypothetical protein [Aestuariivirga sp.]|uniref:hypothetical protein n=1 Tax=Aestuariivirga sp. TaxID=2650926 RepID=UPI0039E49949